MAWSFRRSIKFGPVRINMSKSGVGYSVGGTGFRIGKDAKGRQYTQASIPGTGVYNRSYSKSSKQGSACGSRSSPAFPAAGLILVVLWLLYKLFS
jgi:hypothetical protein